MEHETTGIVLRGLAIKGPTLSHVLLSTCPALSQVPQGPVWVRVKAVWLRIAWLSLPVNQGVGSYKLVGYCIHGLPYSHSIVYKVSVSLYKDSNGMSSTSGNTPPNFNRQKISGIRKIFLKSRWNSIIEKVSFGWKGRYLHEWSFLKWEGGGGGLEGSVGTTSNNGHTLSPSCFTWHKNGAEHSKLLR